MKASNSEPLSNWLQFGPDFVRQFNKICSSIQSNCAISLSSYSSETLQASVPSMFVVGRNLILPSFKMTAIILKICRISSWLRPIISRALYKQGNLITYDLKKKTVSYFGKCKIHLIIFCGNSIAKKTVFIDIPQQL